MASLDKQFNKFYDSICIHNEAEALREKRDKLKEDIEKYLPDELEKIGISVSKSDFEFFNQGSYAIGTTIQNEYGAIDLDYGLIIPIETSEFKDTRKIKVAVKKSLLHVANRTVKIKEPCITASYSSNGKEYLHIDFPVYASNNSCIYLARGKENSDDNHYKWENADPKGLIDYFNDKISGNNGLRRAIRFVKKWKQESYKNSSNDNEIPPSVALTILVCENYVEKDNDISSLYETLSAIKNRFTVSSDINGNIFDATITCYLPVEPWSDTFYKLKESSSHMITLYKRLNSAVANLKNAIDLEDEHEAGKYVQKVLGDSFEIPPKEAKTTSTKYSRENSFG